MDGDESKKRKDRHATFRQQHQMAPSASLPATSGGGDNHFDISAGFHHAHAISPLWSPMGGAGLMLHRQVSELNTIRPGLQQPFVPQRNILDPNSVIQRTGLMEAIVKSRVVEPPRADSITIEELIVGVGDCDNVREQRLSVDDRTTSSAKRKEPTRATEGTFDGRWCHSCCNRTGPCEAGVHNSCQVCMCT